MGFLSDRILRISALVVGVSGWIVALGVAANGTGHPAKPAPPLALAASIPAALTAQKLLTAAATVRVRAADDPPRVLAASPAAPGQPAVTPVRSEAPPARPAAARP